MADDDRFRPQWPLELVQTVSSAHLVMVLKALRDTPFRNVYCDDGEALGFDRTIARLLNCETRKRPDGTGFW